MLLFILIPVPAMIALIEFISHLIAGKGFVHVALLRITEIASFVILPLLYIIFADTNDCCGDSSAFSPEHRLTIIVIISLCVMAYFYSSYRKTMSTPVIEILVNAILIICIVLNIFIAIQTDNLALATIGNLPIIIFTIIALIKNQYLFIDHSQKDGYNNRWESIAFRILRLQPIIKFPILFIICLPVVILITSILLLFGQKPDSLVRAFTDTYKHGFSEWDYKCDNVQCGGHYLCSVAANGHSAIVKPQRLGIRLGNPIICNRQLLISNAFEDLLQEKLPVSHKIIRKNYDKVGDCVHRYYNIFNNKFVADFVYVIMKPLEWIFLLTLYTFDKNPENRIAKQYVSYQDRKSIDNYIKEES